MCLMEWCSQQFFNVCRGICQGGILFPILFIVYGDELISLSKNKKLGCHVSMYCVDCLMYADNLILLSASLSELYVRSMF